MQTMQALQVVEETATRITEPMPTPDEVSITPFVSALVHYVITDSLGRLQHRPAIIVRIWSDTRVNLQVFTDGPNDGERYDSGITWAPSVQYSEVPTPGTWHWPC